MKLTTKNLGGDGMKATIEWVSIDDRLPDMLKDQANSDRVLMACKGEFVIIGRYYREPSHRYMWRDCEGFVSTGVTYWAEIPPVPEKG